MPNKVIGTLLPLFSTYTKNSFVPGYAGGMAFLEWLVKTDQNAWQLLPLHETQLISGSFTEHVASPFKGYGIGLDPRYLDPAVEISEGELGEFREKNSYWLGDYVLFCALRDQFGTDDWSMWDARVRDREAQILTIWSEVLSNQILEYERIQCALHKQHAGLLSKAKQLGIRLIGDMPFYLSHRSPLVWANPEMFELGENNKLIKVSGIPNSDSAYFGRQLWGHPLYKWTNSDVTELWRTRFRYLRELYDQVRVDHMLGLFRYGALDLADSTRDEYRVGPGTNLLKAIYEVSKSCGLEIFAEDSGNKAWELRASLESMGIPGIKIWCFAYNERLKQLNSMYAGISSYNVASVAYTTTHDTHTLITYINKLTVDEKQTVAREGGFEYSDNNSIMAKNAREAIINSPSQTIIIPIQDWFLWEERVNTPGSEKERDDPNWRFKLPCPVEELPDIGA